ncbi:lipid A biosynthesis acyltransferase [Candidatus Ruthia endofausta]|uniref:Lipid A biosynthesis acyltransferase n=1 Tax=Candidatus Ruthia endofausta TaxID=2738852 RepID=A0A6N0HN71_9GAMM|nr:lipid A biosynthesis acyltransferase [Candidatus Ruthia endofausta]QKQ23784.1 lipid A biosynthesis acyltransferase [Candidatus Ruthia endofausta]
MTKTKFYHPKFIPTWTLIGLMKLSAKLPLKIQLMMGKIIGRILYLLLSRYRKIAFVNITKCFPNKNKVQVTRLVKQHFGALGIGLFEIANCFYLSDKKLKQRYHIEGSEILQNALDKQQKIILLVGHFTTMMLAGRMLLQNFNFADVYRPQNNALFDNQMQKIFTQHGSLMIKVKDTRTLIRTLKSGLPIWYTHDQDLGAKISIFSPFFDIQTATIKATEKLARIDSTVVIPFSFVRQHTTYTLKFSPALIDYPNDKSQQNTRLTNQILQQQILKAPEQYLWIHRRFKTRPNNEPSFY